MCCIARLWSPGGGTNALHLGFMTQSTVQLSPHRKLGSIHRHQHQISKQYHVSFNKAMLFYVKISSHSSQYPLVPLDPSAIGLYLRRFPSTLVGSSPVLPASLLLKCIPKAKTNNNRGSETKDRTGCTQCPRSV